MKRELEDLNSARNLMLENQVYELPSEILQDLFILYFLDKEYNCQMDAGFMGVKETKWAPGVYNVKPIIGWSIQFYIPEKKKETVLCITNKFCNINILE